MRRTSRDFQHWPMHPAKGGHLMSRKQTPYSFRRNVTSSKSESSCSLENRDQARSGHASARRMGYHSLGQRERELANVLQLLFIHPEIVAHFMDHCHPDLLADFFLAWNRLLQCSSGKASRNPAPSADQRRSFWSWGRHGTAPEANFLQPHPTKRRAGSPCEGNGSGGRSSTRTAMLLIRLRNSLGSESSASSTSRTKSSRFILSSSHCFILAILRRGGAA